MANSRNLPPTTAFTKAFAAALREVMTARGVVQTKVAAAINRDQTFVSERTSGKRPCDTDIIAGVAEVAGVTPQTIVRETLAKMKQRAGDDLARKRDERARQVPSMPRRTVREPKVAKTSAETAGAPQEGTEA